MQREFTNGLPGHLAPYWVWDFWSFHSPDWWKRLWTNTGKVDVTYADSLPDGWRQWLLWSQVCQEAGYHADAQEIAMLQADAGANLGFTRVVAQRKA